MTDKDRRSVAREKDLRGTITGAWRRLRSWDRRFTLVFDQGAVLIGALLLLFIGFTGGPVGGSWTWLKGIVLWAGLLLLMVAFSRRWRARADANGGDRSLSVGLTTSETWTLILSLVGAVVAVATMQVGWQQTRSGQRAYVVLSDVSGPATIQAGQRLVFQLKVMNTGLTPALAVSSGSALTLDTQEPEFGDVDTASDGAGWRSLMDLGAGRFNELATDGLIIHVVERGADGRYARVAQKQETLTTKQVDAILAGTLKLYLFNRTLYRDVFAPTITNITTTCLIVTNGKGLVHCGKGSLLR